MTKDKIKAVLSEHKKWLLSGGVKGKRADFQLENLRKADLRKANLVCANLCHADLEGADLRGANLQGANLRDANLEGANLLRANLYGADLREANLDYSCLPLWCGSLNLKIDAGIAAQFMYHTMRAIQSVKDDADIKSVLSNPDNIRLANRFHRVVIGNCRMIEKMIEKKKPIMKKKKKATVRQTKKEGHVK